MARHESDQRECDRDGVGWWDGNRSESRAERGSLAEYSCSLAFPLNQASSVALFFPCYLSFSTFFSLSTVYNLLSLYSVSSFAICLALSVLILSILAQLKMQLLTAHHLGLDHHPLIVLMGSWVSFLYRWSYFSLKQKGQIPIYITVAAGIGKGDLGKKKIFSYRRLADDDGFTEHIFGCHGLISSNHCSESFQWLFNLHSCKN